MNNILITKSQLTNLANQLREYTSASEKLSYPYGFINLINTISLEDQFISEYNDLAPYLTRSLSIIDDSTITKIESYQYCGFRQLSVINLPNCTELKEGAFYCCDLSNIVHFELNKCKKIGELAFANCFYPYQFNMSFPICTFIDKMAFRTFAGLGKIEANNCSEIGEAAFFGCHSLVTVFFDKCTKIGSFAFSNCPVLRNIIFSSTCNDVGEEAFALCEQLQELNFPKLNIIPSRLCQEARYLSTINIPECQEIHEYAFYSTSIGSISLDNCTYIGSHAFASCQYLNIIALSKCTTIDSYAFQWCYNLYDVSLPACKIIGEAAFSDCYRLEFLSLPACTNINDYAFTRCTSLKTLYFESSIVPSFSSSAFYDTLIHDIYVNSTVYMAYQTALQAANFNGNIVPLEG